MEANSTTRLPEVNITLIDTNKTRKSPIQEIEYSCDYRLRLKSTSLQALEGIGRMLSISEAKRGQYLIPDANLTWEASDPKCLSALKGLEVDGGF